MPRPWYADGVRFGCTQGGDCCKSHGEYDHVYFTKGEVRALAAHLGTTVADVRRRYLRREEGYTVARSRGDACIFLSGCACSIYAVRPVPCRTWPFWPETMKRVAWRGEVETFCKGVGRGRLRTRAEIERAIEEKAEHDRVLETE